MPKIKKQIQDSKLKRDFKKREKIRVAKKRSKKESEVARQKDKSKAFVTQVKRDKQKVANAQKLTKLLDQAPQELEDQVLDTLQQQDISGSELSDSDVFEMPESELEDLDEKQESEKKEENQQATSDKPSKKKSKTVKLIDPSRLKELLKNARQGSTSALRKLLYLFKEIFLISSNISPEMALQASTKTVENSIFRAFFLVIPELVNKQQQKNQQILGKVYSGYLIQIISQLSDLKLVIEHIDPIAAVVRNFSSYQRKLTHTLLTQWDGSQKELKSKLVQQSGQVLYHLTKAVNKNDYTQLVIKRMYLCLTGASKRAMSNRTIIPTMKESLKQVLSLNSDVSYQSGFLFLRQLAIHVRKALQKPSTQVFESQIFTHQILECLDVWKIAIISALHTDLNLLVYPFSQLVFCILRLSPDLRFVPSKFRLVEMLHEIAAASNTYEPTAGILLEILSSRPNWYVKDPKSEGHFSFEHAQLTKQHLKNPEVLVSILKRVRLLLLQFFALNESSVAFPELVMPVEESLRKFLKHNCPTNAKGYFKRLLDVVHQHAALIKNKRNLKQLLEIKIIQLDEPSILRKELKKLKE